VSVATSQVAVLGSRGHVTVVPAAAGSGRTTTRVVAFAALALYGTLKWSTLLTGHPLGRLMGLLALAIALAVGRPVLARRSRVLAAAATVLALLAVFPIAGVPLAWVWHVRIAVTANAIGEGLSALPQVLVPYSGINQWVDLVMMLGAAVLLFDGALLVAFAPGQMQPLRRAGAALPLVALAAVPTTLVRPALPYLDGAILFGLLVAFMWGEEIGRRRAPGALGIGALAVVAALVLAPALDRHKPWFDYRALAGGLGPGVVDAFDWTQGYGRIDWPRAGRLVLEVKASRGEYWKAEDLDFFDGTGWEQGQVKAALPPPARSSLKRWTQTIQVTIRDMRISQVVGAGTSYQPTGVQSLSSGVSAGTWTTIQPLVSGDAYEVRVYSPHPSAAQLAAAGAGYPAAAAAYRTIALPPTTGTPSPSENYLPAENPNNDSTPRGYQAQLVFPPFHSGRSIASIGGPRGVSAAALLRSSDVVGGYSLADAYRLAQRLAAGAATPYQFVQSVERYLGRGYKYNENPPYSPFPLVSFLFSSHLGYCQQFAGSMALLLRMGGVPARVATGFTPGREDSAIGRWLVRDYDAHAWDEVWFPRYGWVRFDPTPVADPARSGHSPASAGGATNLAATGAGLSASKTVNGARVGKRRAPSRVGLGARRSGGASSEVPWIIGPAALLGLVLVAVGIATKPLRSVDALIAELEAALRRIGRPLPGGATLTWLERRLGGSPEAVAYVRELRLARFRGGERLPSGRQRRALRRQLRLGLGLSGAVRSVWALPPRWGAPSIRGGRARVG